MHVQINLCWHQQKSNKTCTLRPFELPYSSLFGISFVTLELMKTVYNNFHKLYKFSNIAYDVVAYIEQFIFILSFAIKIGYTYT
jgi:hypothetical protein